MKKKITSMLFILSTLFINAQPLSVISLIPTPQKIELNDGVFTFEGRECILLGDPNDEDDNFASGQLIEVINDEMKVNLSIKASAKYKFIAIGLKGRDKLIDEQIKKENLIFTEDLGAEGYVLKITKDKIIIAAENPAGVFYGVQTLKQIIKANRTGSSIPCLLIVDKPAMPLRGWMDDISRGPIPTMEFLKKTIRTLSEYKQNYFTLYTEHTFRLKKYPDISPVNGITAEEISELVEYAKKYHVEVIGNAQSFGHMRKILDIPFYSSLAENPDVLNPADESSYKFLDDFYSEAAPAYSNEYFNINCDEVFGLGQGPAKEMVEKLGVSAVYADHINRINSILKKYGKKIMMWGDIAVNNSDIIEKLPKDITILSWGYHAADSFNDAILPFKNSGFEFMVAPGVSCWSEIWPNMSNAVVNISNYVRDGYRLGAKGMMNTAWDDDGENLFNYNWHGLIWGAECSWNPAKLTDQNAVAERESRLKHFNNSFDKIFFATDEISVSRLLSVFNEIRLFNVRNILRDEAFWESILNIFPDNISDEFSEENNKVKQKALALCDDLSEIKKSIAENAELIDHALFAAKRIVFTADKNLTRIILAKAMKTNKPEDIKAASNELHRLLLSLHEIKKDYIALWERENRSWWLDRVLDKYNKLGNEILNLDKNVFIVPADTADSDARKIELSTAFGDKSIYYTLDGSEPNLRSNMYNGAFVINGPALIRARVIDNSKLFPVAEKFVMMHKALGRISKLNCRYSSYNPAYSAGGDLGLADGLKGTDNFADGRWQGYQGQDIDVILDFKESVSIDNISVSFLQNSYSWILFPKTVKILISDDGTNFNLVKEIENHADPLAEGTMIHDFKFEMGNLNTRYIRLLAVSQGDLPGGHHAAGNPSFMFADEIMVE